MSAAFLFGRFCGSRVGGSPQLLARFATPFRSRINRIPSWPPGQWRRSQKRLPVGRTVLIASLTPAAFLELAENGDGQEKTGEMQMLEVSREEVRKNVSKDARGLNRLAQSLFVFWYYYVYDPIATGIRFVHLAIVFVPVILTAPTLWLGRRAHNGKGERTGAIWWYGFLVRSMERAGPAFIKVSLP